MIGDVLTSSILFKAIKEKYPKAELHYLINSHTYAVVENNPYIDDFQFFTKKNEEKSTEVLKFAKQLKQQQYHVVIDAYSKLSSNLISYYSGAKTKISKYKWYSSFLYTHAIKYSKTPKTNAGLAIENRLQLLQPLGIDASKIIKPIIYLTATEKENAKQFLVANGITIEKPLIMISVLGSGKNKTYPFNYMAQVLDTLVNTKSDCQILFNYIPKQKPDAEAIYNLCKPATQKRIFFEVFGNSLRAFLAITYYCKALIGNEGGAVNMAKALNVPTFTVFSPWINKEDWTVFDDGKKHTSVHLKDYKPELFNNKTAKQLKQNVEALYKAFKPQFFEQELKQFVGDNL